MPLAPGQSLLHFRLVDKLGEGGMGEVWRAMDTTLDREVAIKVLPQAFASDPDRLARFEREAKVLAALNHTNIAAIYGFPEGAPSRFLAMELVPGDDLSKVLARSPLPVREALDAARQIASALEAAHERGVIHRDLKPANVKRTPDGTIKVLDFGLAKALEIGGVNSGLSATVTSAGSHAGMILGTASYMSPEQARGQTVDRRTDLWAFGCLLYEMLTGTKAFDGPTVTDVLAKVVTGEPDWDRLPAAAPAAVRRLLRRCLEKDVRKRLRDAGDASLLLDDNPEDVRSGPVPVAPAERSRRSLIAPILGALIAVAGVAAGWGLAHREPQAKSASLAEFTRVTYAKGMLRSARFAPDGRTIVYGAAWNAPPIKLYLARTESPEAAPIPAPAAELFSISKNGEMAISLGHAYFGWMAEGTLARISLLGGAPREVLPGVRSADWSPDGTDLAIVRRVDGWDRLEFPVGTVLDKTVGYFEGLRFSPDGSRIAYADHPSWGDNQGGLSVVDRAGKKSKLAEDFASIQGVAWAPGGKEVWFTATSGQNGSAIHAVDLAGRRRVVFASIGSIELFDIASDGRLLLGDQRAEREAIALLAGDREPRELAIPGETSIVRSMTPDGGSIIIANQVPEDYETYLIRADRPGAVRLSGGESMALSPDGAWALSANAGYDTFYLTPTSMGPTRTIPNPDHVRYLSIAGWLPDGKRIVCTGRKGEDAEKAYVFDVETGAATTFGPPGLHSNSFAGPPVSPDGREIVLRDAGGTLKRWRIADGGSIAIPGLLPEDQALVYTEDGAGLFVSPRSFPIVVERVDLSSGRRTPCLTLAPHQAAGTRLWIPTVSPNGKYWSLSTSRLLTDLYVVDGLR